MTTDERNFPQIKSRIKNASLIELKKNEKDLARKFLIFVISSFMHSIIHGRLEMWNKKFAFNIVF